MRDWILLWILRAGILRIMSFPYMIQWLHISAFITTESISSFLFWLYTCLDVADQTTLKHYCLFAESLSKLYHINPTAWSLGIKYLFSNSKLPSEKRCLECTSFHSKEGSEIMNFRMSSHLQLVIMRKRKEEREGEKKCLRTFVCINYNT